MKKIFKCRRSSLALIGMGLLFILGLYKSMDVAMGIAAICAGVAGSNAYEKSKTNAIQN